MSQEIDFLARIQGQPDYPILPDTDRLEIDSLVREYAGLGMTADLRRRARSQLIRLQENHAFLDAGQSAELRKILKPGPGDQLQGRTELHPAQLGREGSAVRK